MTDKVEAKIHKRIVWADAPPPRQKPKTPTVKVKKISKWEAVANKIRKNTKNAGRWALVASDIHFTYVTRLNKQFPDIKWTARKNGDRHDLWASLKINDD